jgi:hypothetical protein
MLTDYRRHRSIRIVVDTYPYYREKKPKIKKEKVLYKYDKLYLKEYLLCLIYLFG